MVAKCMRVRLRSQLRFFILFFGNFSLFLGKSAYFRMIFKSNLSFCIT